MLPDNSLLLTAEMEMIPLYGFVFADPNQQYEVTVNEIFSEEDALESLQSTVSGITKEPVEYLPYEKNGLSGWYTTYHDKRNNHYLEFSLTAECGLEDGEGNPLNTLSIVVLSDGVEGIKAAFTGTLIRDFLETIQLTK